MATLHLLPRELVHLLASRPAFPAPSTAASGHRLHSLLFAQQLPRFSSDYRRVTLDAETARDFDRPSEGYEYPSIAGEQQDFLDQASFIEEDEAEYRFQAPKASTSSPSSVMVPAESVQHLPQRNIAIGARAVSKAALHADETPLSSTRMLHLAMNNSANCLKRGEFDSALAWFIDAPPVSVAFAHQQRRIATLASDLRDQLMQQRADNIPLLVSFTISYASKGLTQSLPRLVPHIARFSTYERLEPFWNELSYQARRTCKLYRPASSMPVLERTLIHVGNRVVRSLILSDNYVDALKFLQELRSQERRLADPNEIAIEYDTYRIFLEELKRYNTHSNLHAQVMSSFEVDYGTMTLADPENTVGLSFSTSAHQSLDGHSLGEGSSARTVAKANKEADATMIDTPESVYSHLKASAMRGEVIDRRILQKFSNLCVKNDKAHLARSLARVMAMTDSEREYRALLDQMSRGELPTVRTLSSFVDACVQGRQLDLATRLGRWMERQSIRFRTLWICAKMHRLIRRGQAADAREALQLYKEYFLPNGLPEPIVRYFRYLGDRVPSNETQVQTNIQENERESAVIARDTGDLAQAQVERERLLFPASSHSIALAIQAWLIYDPQESNVMETYRSFLQVSYSDNEHVRVPMHLMPDQVSFGPFLKNLSRNGKHAAAMRVLNDMRKRGVQPNAHNWDTVIGAFAKAGNFKVVGHIIRRMETAQEVLQGKRETAAGYALGEAVAGAAMKDHFAISGSRFDPELGDIHALLEGFQFYPPTLVTYTTTIRGFAMAGRLDKAKYYMRKMFVARDLQGDLLYRFGRSPKAEKVLDIVSKMSNLADVGRRISHRRVYTRMR